MTVLTFVTWEMPSTTMLGNIPAIVRTYEVTVQ